MNAKKDETLNGKLVVKMPNLATDTYVQVYVSTSGKNETKFKTNI